MDMGPLQIWPSDLQARTYVSFFCPGRLSSLSLPSWATPSICWLSARSHKKVCLTCRGNLAISLDCVNLLSLRLPHLQFLPPVLLHPQHQRRNAARRSKQQSWPSFGCSSSSTFPLVCPWRKQPMSRCVGVGARALQLIASPSSRTSFGMLHCNLSLVNTVARRVGLQRGSPHQHHAHCDPILLRDFSAGLCRFLDCRLSQCAGVRGMLDAAL